MEKSIDEIIVEIRPHIAEICSLIGRRAALEKELSVLNLKLNQEYYRVGETLKAVKQGNYSKDDVAKVLDSLRPTAGWTFDVLSTSEKSRLRLAHENYEQIKDWKFNVFFDYPHVLQVYLSNTGVTPRVVGIVQSITKDISNITNPIILAAINRYRRLAVGFKPIAGKRPPRELQRSLPLSSESAYYALERIANAIRFKTNVRMPKGLYEQILTIANVFNYGDEYFEKLVQILKSDLVRNQRTTSNKMMYVRTKLREAFREIDHAELFAWIESRFKEDNFPNRLDSKTLFNDFVAWKCGVKRSSAKTYVSRSRKFAAKYIENPITEKDAEKMVEEVLSNLIPITEMPGETQVHDLVFDDAALDYIATLPDPDSSTEK
jgi:hypothetical protein